MFQFIIDMQSFEIRSQQWDGPYDSNTFPDVLCCTPVLICLRIFANTSRGLQVLRAALVVIHTLNFCHMRQC